MPRQPRSQQPDVYVATDGFAAEIDGERYVVGKGELVRAGHPLIRAQPGFFRPADTAVRYDVEQATAAPGELRGGIAPNPTTLP
jgi:hypothetical protein